MRMLFSIHLGQSVVLPMNTEVEACRFPLSMNYLNISPCCCLIIDGDVTCVLPVFSSQFHHEFFGHKKGWGQKFWRWRDMDITNIFFHSITVSSLDKKV